jgi:hypothetical protein
MSAAAGISAAKKRRGVISSTPEPSTKQTSQQQQQQQQQQSPVMITPIQILQNHELRLKAVEQQLIVAEESSAALAASAATAEKISKSALVQAALPSSQQDEMNKLKTRCETLEKKLEEMSSLVHKIQTFSMESNHAFLKLKRVVDEDFENRIQELKQTFMNSDDSMINRVKQDTAAALSSMSANVASAVEENIHLNVIEQL